jgi:hypothetical protein
MSTNYPGALDSFVNPTATDTLDSATVPHATQHADANDAIEAIEVTLGVNPQGGSATVVARLTALDSTVAGKASLSAANTFTTGAQTIRTGADATKALILQRNSATQSANIVSVVQSDGTTELTRIRPIGQIGVGSLITNTALGINTDIVGDNRAIVIKAGQTTPTNNAIELLPLANNTPVMKVDFAGNITAPTFIGSLTGNATTATTASAVPASGITGATLASNVTASSLTSLGTDPVANTQAVDDNSTKIATTAFVLGQAGSVTPNMDGTAAVGTSTRYARADHVHGSDTTKANLSGATFTGAVAVSSGNLSQTGSGQVLVQSTSTSAVPVVVKPAGSLTITGLTATHSGGAGVTFDTVSGFSSTVGLVAGQSVVMSGFSDSNFNGTTTITVVSATTIRVTSLQGTNGTGTGGQIVATATQQNLQEWQYNSGTAVASVGASGIVTASSFAGSGASLTSLPGGNLVDGTVTAAKLSSTAAAPSLWYSPTSNYTTGTLVINTPVDPFGLTNGVTVGNSKTYLVEYILLGVVTHSSSISTGIRVTITGDAVANVGLETLQASIATSANGNWPTANNYSAYINGTTSNWQIGGSIVTGTSIPFKITLRGILRTAASGSYFQPKLALTTVATTSTITVNRESYASLIELGTSSATTQGTWA